MINFTLLTDNDLQFLNEIRNECFEYLHDSRTFTLEETVNWFMSTHPSFWIVWYNTDKIGYFRTSNYSKINKNIYIGADLHKDFRGKGFAFESYRKFIPKLFSEYDLHKISLEVLSNNERAINLYKKLEFVVEGKKREEVYKNGIWIDSLIMSMTKEEFLNNKNF